MNFFSCGNFSSYVSQQVRQPGGIYEPVRQVYAEVSSLELTISDIAFNGRFVDAKGLSQLQDQLKNIYEKCDAINIDPLLNVKNGEFLMLMQVRIFSLFEQTRIIAKTMKENELAKNKLPPPNVPTAHENLLSL